MAARYYAHRPKPQDPHEPLSAVQMIQARNLVRFGGYDLDQLATHFRRASSVIRAAWPHIIEDRRLPTYREAKR